MLDYEPSYNVENMKELMYYRKAIKLLKEDDSSREVWYVGENGKTYCMRGNTVILALQQGIYRFYDTCEEAEKSKINDWIEDTQQCCSCCANEYGEQCENCSAHGYDYFKYKE